MGRRQAGADVARGPKFDGGIATRIDSVPFSIVVNRAAKRFYDEGEDFWPKRYAIWGRLIAQQPDQIAYSIIDAKAEELFLPSIYPPIRAQTIEGLAAALGLRPGVHDGQRPQHPRVTRRPDEAVAPAHGVSHEVEVFQAEGIHYPVYVCLHRV